MVENRSQRNDAYCDIEHNPTQLYSIDAATKQPLNKGGGEFSYLEEAEMTAPPSQFTTIGISKICKVG